MTEKEKNYYIRERKPGDRVFRVPRVTSWQITPGINIKPRVGGVSPLILVYGFALVIAAGTVLLCLPFATQTGKPAMFINALFTAASATCVTGLVVVDTGTYWSIFGQIIIAILMHIGGFGFMTVATIFLLALGRRIGLKERILIRESLGVARLGGVVRIVKNIVLFTFTTEILGAALIYLHLSTVYSPGVALWKSVFHAISAFNNAGFDLFGGYNSLIPYQNEPLMLLTTAVLIILGGISYLVLADMLRARKFIRFTVDSKLVIVTTLGLIVFGTLILLLTEMNNPATMANLGWTDKITNAFFHAVSPRSAGFSSLPVGNFAVYSLFFTMLLMFIGGAAGSTSGGIKVNTLGMLASTVWSTLRGKENAGAYGREFTNQQIHRAMTLVLVFLTVISIFTFSLTITEEFNFLEILFESMSALGTVGLSTGITPSLSIAGKIIISLLMFMGRLLPLMLVIILAQRHKISDFRYPQETIRIG